MGLPKGRTNNPSGRKKGIPNKVGRTVKEQIKTFVEAKMLELPALWLKLTPKEKAQLLTNLLPYIEAKMQAVAVSGQIDFNSLSESEIDAIGYILLNKTKNKDNEKNE